MIAPLRFRVPTRHPSERAVIRMYRPTKLLLLLIVLLAACGGGSDEPQPAPSPTAAPTTDAPADPPATTAAPTTTTNVPAPAATTTVAPAPTTTIPSLPGGDELLTALNKAMAASPEYLATGQGYVKESANTPNDQAYVTQLSVGGGPAGGDLWRIAILEISSPAIQESFFVQARTVNGTDYEQDPTSGLWEIDNDTDSDPIEDAFAGTLELTDIIVGTSGSGYTLTGTYPHDPVVETVVLTMNAETGLLRSVQVISRRDRGELQSLGLPAGGDLYVTSRVDVTTYTADVADIAAPPVGTATKLIPDPEGPFLVSIPSDWEQIEIAELDASGFTDGYASPDGILLLVLLEDLTGTGIMNLGGYADAIAANLGLLELDLTYFDATTTLQGEFVWLIDGADPEEGSSFRRLIYLTPEGIGVNLTFVQANDPATGDLTLAWDQNQGLINFMINSFMTNP